jgi:P-type Cu+ transporter
MPKSEHHSNGLQTMTIEVGGMDCASCVGHVERALRGTEGVAEANVNFATELATVRFDPARTKAADLADAVRRAGYSASLPSQDDGPSARAHEHAGTSGGGESAAWRRSAILGLALAVPVVVLGMAVPGTPSGVIQAVLTGALQVAIGRRFYAGAARAAAAGRADMDTLVALGTTAAFAYSIYTLALPWRSANRTCISIPRRSSWR